jgi:hypothetical protein
LQVASDLPRWIRCLFDSGNGFLRFARRRRFRPANRLLAPFLGDVFIIGSQGNPRQVQLSIKFKF